MLTVTSPDSILHVGTYTDEFDVHNMVHALLQACGVEGPSHTRMISSDKPEALDHTSLRSVFPRAIVSGDPLHLALIAEKVASGKKTVVSKCVRACVSKLRHGLDDGRRYFRATHQLQPLPKFEDVVAGMSARVANQRVVEIQSENYPAETFSSVLSSVEDIAAVVKNFKSWMQKRPKNKDTTAYSSIAYSMVRRHLGYLLNYSRFVARKAELPVPYGTTLNEAFHNELLVFFRIIRTHSLATVTWLAKVITSTKLVAGMANKSALTKTHSQSMLLREYCQGLESAPLKFEPLIRAQPESSSPIDLRDVDVRATGVARRHGVHKRAASNIPMMQGAAKKRRVMQRPAAAPARGVRR